MQDLCHVELLYMSQFEILEFFEILILRSVSRFEIGISLQMKVKNLGQFLEFVFLFSVDSIGTRYYWRIEFLKKPFL
jgi:hypothetical protein